MHVQAFRRERRARPEPLSRPRAALRQRIIPLRIDGLFVSHAAHLELALLDRKGKAALDQIERIPAKLLIAPAAEDIEVLANACRKRFKVVGSSDQAGRDARVLCPDLEQELQEVADERCVLGEARAPGFTVWHITLLQWFGARQSGHEATADVIGLPSGRKTAHASEIFLSLGRMENDLVQRIILDNPAAREVLRARFRLAPTSERS